MSDAPVTRLSAATWRTLFWARGRGSFARDLWEVSRHPAPDAPRPRLLPRCATAPSCPGDTHPPGSYDPDAPAHAACPYAFATRYPCRRALNRAALELALFLPAQVQPARAALQAAGYDVQGEAVELDDSTRVLAAHGAYGPPEGLDVRMLVVPGLGHLALVRPHAGWPRLGQLRPAKRPT